MNTKKIRKKIGFTQKELAEYLNVSYRTLQNWENKDSCPEYIIELIEYKIIKEFKLEEKNTN